MSVRVYYDRRVTKRSDARVIALDLEFAETDGAIPEALGLFVDGLGRPTSGADHLSRGLETGVAQWDDPWGNGWDLLQPKQ